MQDNLHLICFFKNVIKLKLCVQGVPWGSIEYAECTQAEDAKKIRQEISGESHEVDYAIHVLLTAGMSTPSLRDIARAGVDIERTAYSGIASSVVILFPVDLMTFIFAAVEAVYLRSEWWRLFLSSLSVSARLILAWMLCRSSIDERCFMLKVMDKIVAALLALFVVMSITTKLPMSSISTIWIICSNGGFAAMIAFALLGIRGTSYLPYGHGLLQFFFARGTTSFTACKCCACSVCLHEAGCENWFQTQSNPIVIHSMTSLKHANRSLRKPEDKIVLWISLTVDALGCCSAFFSRCSCLFKKRQDKHR